MTSASTDDLPGFTLGWSTAATADSAEPVIPGGRPTLASLLPAIAHRLGLATYQDRLGLPAARSYVVVMVDGLGWHQLRAHRQLAAQFCDMAGAPLWATVPSTTGTSLTSLGTGRQPGEHGMAGYLFRPAVGQPMMNAVTWDNGPDARSLQTHPTMFEVMAAAGVAVSSVVPSRFENSGLTGAALRGARVIGQSNEDDLATRLADTVAATAGDSSLVYVYERALDHTGHAKGVDSAAWRSILRRTSEWVGELVEALSDEVVVLVTGDHGMIDVQPEHRIVAEWEPALMAGVDQIGGEGRLRQLYTGQAEAVADRWREQLGELAWVRTRDEAIAEGWFGATDDRVRDRFGDVLVAMREDWAVMTTTLPGEQGLVGMHGSLTAAEMCVPLLMEPGAHG